MSEQENTLYDILDATSDASPQEIRKAYLKAKLTYSKDNPVLYSLISAEDREETLRKIEEAYLILSDPEKRRSYDRSHGLLQLVGESSEKTPDSPSGLFEESASDLLIPPTTDISLSAVPVEYPNFPIHASPPAPPAQVQPSEPPESPFERRQPLPVIPPPPPRFIKKETPPTQIINLMEAIEKETEWRGSFLKKIREAYQISLEEMSDSTKISKTFIIAIEEEKFAKLPAPVYARGFISQIARVLKLPQEKVASAFMSRYHAAQTSQQK